MIYVNVTNSFHTRRWTGIQRVVREVSRHLCALRDDVRLLVFKPTGMHVLSGPDSLRRYLNAQEGADLRRLPLEAVAPGDVLLDMDATWGDGIDHRDVLARLKRQGMRHVKLHHDAVPLLHPQYCDRNTVCTFVDDFQASLWHADHWICTTRTVERDLQALFGRLGHGLPLSSVVPLGANPTVAPDAAATSQRVAALQGRKVILVVGTIEPRKNHALVLDAFDAHRRQHAADDACLVIVGKSGWNNDAIRARITTHPRWDQDVFWFDDVADPELNQLYGLAWVCLCLSHYEGFGLPAVEALMHQVPVLCTAGSALEEVAQGQAVAVELHVDAVVQALAPLLQGEAPQRVHGYTATTWRETALGIAAVIEQLSFPEADFHTVPTQAVYLSIRPDKIRRSLDSVQRRMPFVDEAIVLTADPTLAAMADALRGLTLRVTLLSESQLGLHTLPDDHVARNMLLRQTLYAVDSLRANFLAFDDDYVVADDVDPTVFLEDGRHKAYHFVRQGAEWQGAFPAPTSFDRGVWRTVAYLDQSGYDTRLYSAHQPQIVNKRIANAVYRKTAGLGLDEWSSYFNIASHLKPDGFVSLPYVTAGWPGDVKAWTGPITPTRCLFFNDPPTTDGRENLSSHVQHWLAELQQAKRLEQQAVSASPVFHINEGRAYFSNAKIRCQPSARVRIPIQAHQPFQALALSYFWHHWTFTPDEAPAFLSVLLPPAVAPASLEVPVNVTVHLDGHTVVTATLTIEVVTAPEEQPCAPP
ncbi:hypothetical protein CCO03_02115 [Comamonas serinivorans]|uniref:Glycosyl transferase family 1 domain-containing protein n=1 Tax=Comamonas serinivorans TaxID=1082851 RepID=A0A1Y0EJP0_9BURK|nr:glycosyltransferase family 1 protein [Comamonas serinivorans]ARU03641.1 hypothetical protein CCO03_02115 [Comamonas serinivorans]